MFGGEAAGRVPRQLRRRRRDDRRADGVAPAARRRPDRRRRRFSGPGDRAGPGRGPRPAPPPALDGAPTTGLARLHLQGTLVSSLFFFFSPNFSPNLPVLPGFTRFYWVVPSFLFGRLLFAAFFYCRTAGRATVEPVYLEFTGFYLVLPSFSRFTLSSFLCSGLIEPNCHFVVVAYGFVAFYEVLLCFA